MKKLRHAIIGCGTIAQGRHLSLCSEHPFIDLVCLCDIDLEKAEKMAAKYNVSNYVRDYYEILDDSSIDSVTVCLPNNLHAQVSIDCLNAKKHVLCEKPAAINYSEAYMMKNAAELNSKIMAIAVQNRFNSTVNRIRDIIQSGGIGEIYHVECMFKGFRSIPGLGGHFTTKEISGGGVLIDWGVHFLDLILYCLGDITLYSVSAKNHSVLGRNMKEYAYTTMGLRPFDFSGTYDVEDYTTGMVRTSGPSISFSGAWAQNINETANYVEFHGNKGGIKLEYGKDFVLLTFKDKVIFETKPMYETVDMAVAMMDEFLVSITQGKKNRASITEILQVQLLLDKAYESSEKNKEVLFV